MFQGSPHILLDSKGRLSIPTRFRQMLFEQCAGQLTFTRHPDGCALLYPRPLWEEKRLELLKLPYAARVFQRIVLGSAIDIEMDEAGRILVPLEIRQSCNLSKQLVLVGMGRHFELWDEKKLNEVEKQAMSESQLSEIASSFNF